MAVTSLLSPGTGAAADGSLPDRDRTGSNHTALTDLRLDQVIAAVAGDSEERDLITDLLSKRPADTQTARYRQQVFADLEDPALLADLTSFAAQLKDVRSRLGQIAAMRSPYQQQGWYLEAASRYCAAVRAISESLTKLPVRSPGLAGVRDYLAGYVASPAFTGLAADTVARKGDLAAVTYAVRIKGLRVDVSRYGGEADYSAEVEATFARFAQDAGQDYLVRYRTWPVMSHVGEQILALVARLFPEEFGKLARYCADHAGFIDAGVRQFERELAFFLSFIRYIAPLRSAQLRFCYPEISDAQHIFARDTFDLALAARLVAAGTPVITNEFQLTGPERIIVVSGPNQGGKTTFARTFGQLHHLAAVGCPVPGSAARLFAWDEIFTHFEREEDIADQAGKLEDDLRRVQRVLRAATPRSILIVNEIFSSTSLTDARFLSSKVLEKVVELGALCVCVTFIDELASLAPSVVSMASTVVPEDPARRTFKVVRKPADGLAYALAIADKHGVTYEQLKGRLA